MKYYLVLGLILLSGCSASTLKTKSFVCFNPFFPIQSMQIDTDHPKVKEAGDFLLLSAEDGTVIVMPKSLCVEIRKPN